jgi:outer membrane usher protein
LEDTTDKEIFLTVQYLPKMDQSVKNYYDNLSGRLAWQKEERPEIEFNFQKTFPRGMGYGYVATLTEQDEELKTNMSAQYKTERGVYTVNANGDTQGHLRGSFSVAGGIGILGSQAYFGRPITDSFAVVRVRGLSEVPIKQGDSVLGKTNAAGNLLVAELNSYSQNLLSLGADNLPVNYVLGQADKSVEVKQRSGSLVTFEFTKLTAIEGHLYLQTAPREKKRGELEVLPLEVTLEEGQKRDSFLGQKGYFYLENLPVGTHTLRVRRFGGDCVVRLTVPETDKVVVNFGEVGCLLEKGN